MSCIPPLISAATANSPSWPRNQRMASMATMVTLPLTHDPGAEAQVDFGEAQARIAGELRTVQIFCARLARSTRDVVIGLPPGPGRWLEGHVITLRVWGGRRAAIWYDKPSTLGRLVKSHFIS